MKSIRIWFLCLLWTLPLVAESAKQETSWLLTGAHVLNADGESFIDADVLIEDGRITAIGKNLQASAGVSSSGVPRLDLSGLYLVPGLMDLHTHLLLHPYNETFR